MEKRDIFLIDTNSLITPKVVYYPMDLAPTFWGLMTEKIEDGSIAILDLVKKEILKPERKDDLANWVIKLNIKNYIHHREPEIVFKYAEVLQYIQDDPCYSESSSGLV